MWKLPLGKTWYSGLLHDSLRECSPFFLSWEADWENRPSHFEAPRRTEGSSGFPILHLPIADREIKERQKEGPLPWEKVHKLILGCVEVGIWTPEMVVFLLVALATNPEHLANSQCEGAYDNRNILRKLISASNECKERL